MKIHIIGIPRNPSTPEIAMDPYAMVSYYLTTYLHRNSHDVNYYGFEQSTVSCNKKLICADEEHHKKYNVTEFEKTHWQSNNEGMELFNLKASELLVNNIKDGDIVICMWTTAVGVMSNAINAKFKNHSIKIIDGHVGHRHPSADTSFHVFASYANMHFVYGMNQTDFSYWHDTVIYPMANELNNFTYKDKKKDYFLFIGRLNTDKGLGIFLDLAKHFKDKKFILAGQGNHTFTVPPNVEEVGLLNVEQRKKYLADAKAVISPSHYAEPFGLTAVEAGLSGTPIICTDHGGYTESVIEGVTGFRCSYFNDFVNAINNVSNINPATCRKNAERFSAEILIKDWETYLNKINRDSWYTLKNN